MSALESLAQDFDGFAPTWADLEDRKRHAIDAALAGAARFHSDAVREAILANEHVALSRRYRAFVQSHVDAEYFRRSDAGVHPLARFELDAALRQAYGLRSAYIHRLQSLPTAIALPHAHWETTTVERRPVLTFQGLFRLTRHVIAAFVAERPKIEKEAYDYRLEEAGVVFMEWAPQIWIWRPLTNPAEARRRLEGLLSLITSVIGRDPGATLVDLRPMLVDVERLLPQAAAIHRPALLILHVLFNLLVPPNLRTPGFDAFLDKHRLEVSAPSIEMLIGSTVLDANEDWSIEDHQAVLDQYFAERTRPKGLHAPRLLEAAACLALAEKYRLSGDAANAGLLLGRAVEVHPAHRVLRDFEATYDLYATIEWRAILLPKNEESDKNPTS